MRSESDVLKSCAERLGTRSRHFRFQCKQIEWRALASRASKEALARLRRLPRIRRSSAWSQFPTPHRLSAEITLFRQIAKGDPGDLDRLSASLRDVRPAIVEHPGDRRSNGPASEQPPHGRASRPTTAGDGGEDRDRLAGFDAGLEAIGEADVFLPDVEVDEPTKAPLVVEDPRPRLGVKCDKRFQDLPEPSPPRRRPTRRHP